MSPTSSSPPALTDPSAEAACAAADGLLASAQAMAAWQRISPWLVDRSVSKQVYETGAKALIAGALEGVLMSVDPSPGDIASWRSLILQTTDAGDEGHRSRSASTDDRKDDSTDDPPAPILAALLESHATSGPGGALQRVGELLSATLEALFQHDHANKNAVVLLLLVRQTQARWISADAVRALHQTWFCRFTRGDLSLPYNFLFGGHPHSHANRDDIRALASRTERLVSREGEYSLLHLLFIELVTGIRLFKTACELAECILARRTGWDRSDVSLRAARSLVARYRSGDAPADASMLALVGCEFRLPAAVPATGWRPGPQNDGGATTPPAEHLLFGARWIHERRWQAVQAARSVALTRFPFLMSTFGRRRLKVAVCVSGQLRGYRQALATWRRAFLPMIDATLFIHSWRSVGRAGAHPVRYLLPFEGVEFVARYRQACSTIGYDEVCSRYPTLFRTLAESAQVEVADIAETYRCDQVRLDDELAAPFAGMNNQQKMHSKIEACHALALSSGQTFDLIVRLRPDKPIGMVGFDWNGLAQICRTRPTLFADHPMGLLYANLAIGDQFAVGTPEPMTVYARTWSLYPALAANRLFQCGPDLAGHTSLAQVCWAYGVGVERIPLRFGPLQEAEPMATAAILRSLMVDAEGRMDTIDRSLIEAAAADGRRQG